MSKTYGDTRGGLRGILTWVAIIEGGCSNETPRPAVLPGGEAFLSDRKAKKILRVGVSQEKGQLYRAAIEISPS